MILKYLSSKRIQSRPIWGLISNQEPYLSSQTYKIEKARTYLEHVVNIPCSSNLSNKDVLYVIECLKHPEII